MTAILARREARKARRRAARRRVSDGLEVWLEDDEPTTLGSLDDAFGEKLLAAACLVLMAPSALPLPTGGATHAFSVLALLFAAQLAIGRQRMWMPARWRRRELGPRTCRTLHRIVRVIRRTERWSRPRLAGLLRSRAARCVLGAFVVVLVVASLASPPFSGLDTLPALAVCLVALALLLDDAVFAAAGLVVGSGGIALELFVVLTAGDAVFGLLGLA